MTEYELLVARVKAGALLYKTSVNVPDNEVIYIIRYSDGKDLHIMHPDLLKGFLEIASINDKDTVDYDLLVKVHP